MKKVWLITGSSRGLGKSLAEAVLAKGDLLAATSRKPEDLQELKERYPHQVLTLALEVTDRQQVHDAVAKTVTQFGSIDVLVNNAGFGITGAAEAFTNEQVRSQLEVNLYAPIEITRAVLPYMRKQQSGRVLQVSSIGGRVGNSGLTIYQAAKFGLSGFTEALRKEVAPLGIQVTSVEPGGFRTDWAGSSMSFAPYAEGYDTTVEAIKSFLTNGKYEPIGDPEKAAQAMIAIVEAEEMPVHLVLGSEAYGILKHADAARTEEREKWKYLTLSTDHEKAGDMFATEEGKQYLSAKGIQL